MTTDTPRTDAFCIELPATNFDCNCWSQVIAIADFARQLELELAVSLGNQVKTESDLLQSQDINSWIDSEYRIACKRAEKAEAEVERLKKVIESL